MVNISRNSGSWTAKHGFVTGVTLANFQSITVVNLIFFSYFYQFIVVTITLIQLLAAILIWLNYLSIHLIMLKVCFLVVNILSSTPIMSLIRVSGRLKNKFFIRVNIPNHPKVNIALPWNSLAANEFWFCQHRWTNIHDNVNSLVHWSIHWFIHCLID